MGALRFLVVDGNPAEGRSLHRRDFGRTPGESYGDALLALAPPGSGYDICLPADADAALPAGAALAHYDGIALTGSSLHLWRPEPAVTRQVEFARAAFGSGAAFFGSCWGLQVATVAAGGAVGRNPLGREVGFARNVAPTAAGRAHPLLAGRPPAFDAPAIHLDVVTAPAPGTTVLAANAMTPVQAAEIRHAGGTFWGVQYHPEFTLTETAVILARLAPSLAEEGFVTDAAAGAAHAAELVRLDRARGRRDLAWRHGLDAEVLDDGRRLRELGNWIAHQVAPRASARLRGSPAPTVGNPMPTPVI